MMKPSTSRKKPSKDLIENGMIVAVGVGSIVAVGTQQIAWGVIPIAIALSFNKWYRKQEKHVQREQQLTLLELQQQVNQLQQSIDELVNKQAQLETIAEKQNQLKTDLAELTELPTQIAEIETSYQSLQKQVNQEPIKQLQTSVQQINERLNALNERQTEENYYHQKSIQQLQQELEQARSFPITDNSPLSTQQQLNQLRNYLKQLIRLVTCLAERQRTNFNDHRQELNQAPSRKTEVPSHE